MIKSIFDYGCNFSTFLGESYRDPFVPDKDDLLPLFYTTGYYFI